MQVYKTPHLSQQKAQQTNLNCSKFLILNPQTIAYEIEKYPSDQILRRLFNKLIHMIRMHKIVYVSQDYLANNLDCSREWINKCLGLLEGLGWIKKVYRHMKTCLYYLNPFFQQPHIRKKLAGLLPAIISFNLNMLYSTAQNVSSHNITRDLYGDRYISSLNIYYCYQAVATNDHRLPPTMVTSKRQANLPTNSAYSVGQLLGASAMIQQKPLDVLAQRLSLTIYGRIKLSAYPEDALAEAAKALERGKAANPIAYVHTICRDWCKLRNIEPNWQYMHQQIEQHGCKISDPEQSDTALKNSSSLKPSFTKNTFKGDERNYTSSFSCHDICKRNHVSVCIYEAQRQREESLAELGAKKIEYKTPVHNPHETSYQAAENVIKNWETPNGKLVLKHFGPLNPYWNLLSSEEQGRLIITYPFAATLVTINPKDSYLKELAERVREYTSSKDEAGF